MPRFLHYFECSKWTLRKEFTTVFIPTDLIDIVVSIGVNHTFKVIFTPLKYIPTMSKTLYFKSRINTNGDYWYWSRETFNKHKPISPPNLYPTGLHHTAAGLCSRLQMVVRKSAPKTWYANNVIEFCIIMVQNPNWSKSILKAPLINPNRFIRNGIDTQLKQNRFLYGIKTNNNKRKSTNGDFC